MRETGKVAIARVVIRSKEDARRAAPDGRRARHGDDDLRRRSARPRRIDEIAEAEEVKTTKRELDIAKQLVESLAGDFKPEQYSDTYREQVLEMIERKAAGQGDRRAARPPRRSPRPRPT